MTIRAYIDESQNDDVLVMAGYVASDEEWAKFSNDWSTVLATEPIVTHLKTTKAMANPPLGPFAGLSSNQRDQKLEQLYAVIERYVFFEVSSVVLIKPLKRIFSTDEFGAEASDPFFHGISSLIGGVIRRQLECEMSEKIDFIFDDRTDKHKILDVWDAIVHDLPEEIRTMVGSKPVFQEDTGPNAALPLQAADLEAWWLRKRWEEKI